MSIKFQKYFVLFIFVFVSISEIISQNTPEHDLILSVERIWDRAAHNAFTSLIEFNGRLYCSFRESEGHVSDINGAIRVIASDDGQNWYSVAHLFERGTDLRDPELSVTPDNRIMLNIAGSIYTNGKLTGMEPKVSFSDLNGKNFSIPQRIELDKKIKTGKDWLWRATWHKGKSYGTVYQPSSNGGVLHLVVSNDGRIYKYITTLDVNGGNETTLRFTSDDKMIAVVRRGGNGYIGHSEYPYKNWKWNELGARLGGPDLIILENGNMLCATREYPPDHIERTIIAKVDLDGNFTKLLTLPSEGDCSYPGFVLKNDIMYVSYYSSHEEKTAIYLAKIADLKYGFDSFEKIPEPFVRSDKNGIIELASNDNGEKIVYTLDGSIPTELNAYAYINPIKVTKTTLLRAKTIKNKYPSSNVISQNVGTDIFQESQMIDKPLQNGLKYEYYEGDPKNTLVISSLSKIKSGVIANITTSLKNRKMYYAFKYSGYIKITEDNTYTFYLTSNDGSRFYLNDELVINNDGNHGSKEESVTLSLRKGYHKISLDYFQSGGGQILKLEWKGKSFNKQEIPKNVLFHLKS